MEFQLEVMWPKISHGNSEYVEELHCKMMLNIYADRNKSRLSAFCVEAVIGESTFYDWIHRYPTFARCYEFCKMMAKENWEKEGELLRDLDTKEVGCRFEQWRLQGWTRFGIGKNARIRLHLKEGANPAEHYQQLMKQASNGDFTAGEIKQLMEAINVGLNAHQVFELQKEIDQLKSDLIKISEIKNGENTYTAKSIA